MATIPVRDPIESLAIEQERTKGHFQRLQRFRARVAARRRDRLRLAIKLVVGPLVVGVLVFTALRLTERVGVVRAAAPVRARTLGPASVPAETPTPPRAPAVVKMTPVPNLAPIERLTPSAHVAVGLRSTIVPFPSGVGGVKRDATAPARLEATADERRRSRSDSTAVGAAARLQGEEQDVDTAVPTAAIDWLLKTPRTGVTSASEALLPSKEELLR